jgi:DNA-binding MarR family transcriptional regulator
METTDILIQIRKIVRSINLESKKIQKEYGVSIPQVLCLNYLHESPNFQATQKELKRFLNLNSSTVSGIIRRLEKKGLVARLPKSGDKRVVNIALTSSGDDLIASMPSLLHEQLSTKLETLQESELSLLEESLQKLVRLLDIQAVEASPVITIEGHIEDQEQD